MDNSIFKTISNTIESKKLKRRCLSLEKKFKPTRQSELYRVYELVTDLYFQNYKNEILQICNELEKIEFNGNFNIWSPIEAVLLLKCKILKDRNQEKELQDTLQKIKVVDFFEWDNELITKTNRKVKKRRIAERTLLNDDSIKQAVEDKDLEAELEARKSQFFELLFIYFLSDEELLDIEIEISKEVKRIKEII